MTNPLYIWTPSRGILTPFKDKEKRVYVNMNLVN